MVAFVLNQSGKTKGCKAIDHKMNQNVCYTKPQIFQAEIKKVIILY